MTRRSASGAGLFASLVLSCAGSAAAEDPGRALPLAFFDNDIRFEVAGTISAQCTVAQQTQSASFGPVLDPQAGGNRAADLKLSFDFACNSPFRVVMTSQNGGLVTSAQGSSAFRNKLDYTARLAFDDGRQSEACRSQDMLAGSPRDSRCVFRFRDRDGAAGPATVRLAMAADASPLLAGAYADRLVVRITPLLGGDAD